MMMLTRATITTKDTLMWNFWESVTFLENGCWHREPFKGKNEYSKIRIAGQLLCASRVMYEFANGPIPDGMQVCHACDFPPCVNPSHLYLGDMQRNIRDCFSRGRGGAAKLTPEQVSMIKRRLIDGELAVTLSKEYGVAPYSIRSIRDGITWPYIQVAAATQPQKGNTDEK